MSHEGPRLFRAGRAIAVARPETTPMTVPEQEDTRPNYYKADSSTSGACMIRKLRSGEYRLYSRKINPKTGKRRNLGTFKSRVAAEKHERAVQYFKRH
jgi:hypothetical protein